MVAILDNIMSQLMLDVSPKQAMILILFISLSVSFISTYATKKLVYKPDYVKSRETVQKWRKEYNEAKKNKDNKNLKKLEKKKEQMTKMEAKLSLQSFKSLPVTMPFILVFFWMQTVLGPLGQFVILPFALPYIGLQMNFFWWYLLTSLLTSNLLRKQFGL